MSWRLEPSPRASGMEAGLAARVHDPLWFLCRQWQLGECERSALHDRPPGPSTPGAAPGKMIGPHLIPR